MSEEEIIRDLEDFLWENSIVEGFIDETAEQRQFDVASFSKKDYLAIQGLLDLYQKEKEKNKELKTLIEHNLKYSHELEKDLFENCSNYVISKDKIKAKIEEVNKRENVSIADIFESMKEYAIQVLQELLKEGELI